MPCWLKQSTAREIALGPFVDQTDGFTAETGLTISQADVRLKKNEGDWAQKNETTTMVHEENGWYRCLLNTTDTDTLGILMVAVNESGALPVWREFLVVPANVWDSFLGADLLDVSLEQWRGSAPNALVSSRVDASVGAMASGVITAAAHAAGAIDAAAIADNAIDAGAIAANAITAAKIADGAIDAATFAAGAIDAAAIAADAIGSSELAATAANKIRDTILSDATAFAGANIALIKAKTDNLPSDPADESLLEAAIATRAAPGDAMALTGAERAAVADKVLGRTRAGGADGGRTVAECLAFGRNRWEISGGVLTVYQDDDLTPLYTAAVVTAAGDPVTSVDPT